MSSTALQSAIRDLVTANRIVGEECIVDAKMMQRGLHRVWEHCAARTGRTTDVNVVKS